MQWLAALCVRRPVFAWVLVLSLTVVGLFAFGRLGVDRFPNIDIPTIVVTTRLPGAAPEQIETEVTDKVEEAVNTISAIDTLSSTSSEGISQVVVSFMLEKDGDVAAQEVRDRVNRILPQLPRTALQPTVEKLDPTASPVITVAVTADKPVRDITEFADKVLRRRLESADGVGQVVVIGGRKRQVNVWLDAALLRVQPVGQRRRPRAAGAERRRARRPARPGRAVGHAAHARPDRVGRRLGDVVLRESGGRAGAAARRRPGRRRHGGAATEASVNGEPTVLLQIRKQSGTNTVEVADNIKQRLAELEPILPPGYKLRIVRDEAQFIEASIASVQEHLVVGSILAAIVVLLFLGNLRSTVIAAIAIPTSIIATFALVWYMGFTLNMLTMLALTLAVGIVIDDAIVVLENIFRFIEEKGMPPMGGRRGHPRDRPGGDGHDFLARRRLRAGRLHERHGRPLHGQLRPHDGLCHAGVAVRQLHPHADAVGALAEAAPDGATATRSGSRLFRPLDRGYTRLLDGRWRHAGWSPSPRAGAAVERPAVPDHCGQLPARDDRRSSTSAAPARGHQPRGDELLAKRRAPPSAGSPGSNSR